VLQYIYNKNVSVSAVSGRCCWLVSIIALLAPASASAAAHIQPPHILLSAVIVASVYIVWQAKLTFIHNCRYRQLWINVNVACHKRVIAESDSVVDWIYIASWQCLLDIPRYRIWLSSRFTVCCLDSCNTNETRQYRAYTWVVGRSVSATSRVASTTYPGRSMSLYRTPTRAGCAGGGRGWADQTRCGLTVTDIRRSINTFALAADIIMTSSVITHGVLYTQFYIGLHG